MISRHAPLLVAALIVAGCTEQAAISPSSTATSATPSSTASIPEITTTTTIGADSTLPADTTPPESTSTAPGPTLPPTTTIAATGNPTSTATEYFVGGGADAWLYLGRWTGNDWEPDRDEDQQRTVPSASIGDTVVMHELDAAATAGTVDGTGEACVVDGRTGPVITSDAGAPLDPGSGFRSIAFASDWSTLPRPTALVDADVASYVAAGQAALADTGIDTSTGTIQQLVVADLDGDGDTEALVAFGGSGFSTLLLIDADSGASIRISRSLTTTVPPTTTAAGDSAGEPTTTPAATLRTLAVADLNGDGRFEIVAHSFRESSAEVTVSTYDGTEVNPVLTAGC